MRVGVKLLENREVVEGATEEMKRQRGRLIDELNRIDGVRAFPSETNFVLFSLNRDQDEVYSRLLGEGIIIRRIGYIPGRGGCLRVTVAPREVSMRFLKALREAV
jgi:histidinol-phosphate aminotransferase